jgi:hypothetical protein
MKTHKLMVKTHKTTGLKYLCYTRSEGSYYDNYKGSGKKWKYHLKKYGDDIKTELIFETEDFETFKHEAKKKSLEWNIVQSEEWANLKLEEGDGGDTVSNKKWITNGITDKYLNNDLDLPEGWSYGRSRCVFNDSKFQSDLAKRQTYKQRCEVIQKCWDLGKMSKRDHKKCGTKGNNNPAKRSEVKEKIRQAALNQSKERSERIKMNKPWEARWKKKT